ncbi:type VI lipase adapter Tla3 domain-containing protein [Xanthomonas oryzae]|uniref:type VI lipase adapter Tla3 domain-containing protein n=1 Tax=Xanthomonas oryzae TaxID=347 RepID=UPI002E1CD3B6
MAASAAFGYAAKAAVERWPLPVIVLGPPKDDRRWQHNGASRIAYKSASPASLGLTLFPLAG